MVLGPVHTMACHIILWGPRQRASAPGRSQKNKNQSLWCVNRRIKQRFCCLAWNLWITRNMKLFNTIISNSQVWPADCVRSGRFRKVAGKVQVRSRRDHTIFAETWSEMCWGICWIFSYLLYIAFVWLLSHYPRILNTSRTVNSWVWTQWRAGKWKKW